MVALGHRHPELECGLTGLRQCPSMYLVHRTDLTLCIQPPALFMCSLPQLSL